jgi:hypothetical protein
MIWAALGMLPGALPAGAFAVSPNESSDCKAKPRRLGLSAIL